MFRSTLRFIQGALLLGGLAAPVMPAWSANEALLELLRILRDRNSITGEEYELLMKTAQSENEKAAGGPRGREDHRKTAAAPPANPPVKTKGKLELGDKEHKFRIGGRLQHDVTLVGNDGVRSVGESEQQIRRARIYLSGVSWKHWDWKLQFDLEDADDTGMAIEDAYIKYKAWKPMSITVGQRKAPFSLSELTSSKYITFIERSAPTSLFTSEAIGIGGRAPGITVSNAGDRHALAGGFYLMRQRSGSGESISPRRFDDGWGFTGRAVWLPVKQSANQLAHLGASFGYKRYPNGEVGRVRVRPEVSAGARIVDSDGGITADDFWGAGLEAAMIWGSFSASGEYYYGEFDGGQLAGNADMEGFYVQGSWFPTGESRRYKKGAFSSVKVKRPVGHGGWGAWELGLRYASADLGDSIGADSGEALTAALNWYVNNNMMFRLNYVKTFCEDGLGTTCDWGVEAGDPEYLSFRTQVFF